MSYTYASGFPRLKSELYCESANASEDEGFFKDTEMNMLMELEAVSKDVSLLDEFAWAKHVYEQMYYIWFWVFNIRVKQEFFKESHARLVEYAI